MFDWLAPLSFGSSGHTEEQVGFFFFSSRARKDDCGEATTPENNSERDESWHPESGFPKVHNPSIDPDAKGREVSKAEAVCRIWSAMAKKKRKKEEAWLTAAWTAAAEEEEKKVLGERLEIEIEIEEPDL